MQSPWRWLALPENFLSWNRNAMHAMVHATSIGVGNWKQHNAPCLLIRALLCISTNIGVRGTVPTFRASSKSGSTGSQTKSVLRISKRIGSAFSSSHQCSYFSHLFVDECEIGYIYTHSYLCLGVCVLRETTTNPSLCGACNSFARQRQPMKRRNWAALP